MNSNYITDLPVEVREHIYKSFDLNDYTNLLLAYPELEDEVIFYMKKYVFDNLPNEIGSIEGIVRYLLMSDLNGLPGNEETFYAILSEDNRFNSPEILAALRIQILEYIHLFEYKDMLNTIYVDPICSRTKKLTQAQWMIIHTKLLNDLREITREWKNIIRQRTGEYPNKPEKYIYMQLQRRMRNINCTKIINFILNNQSFL